jgi:hypothetical protein
VEDQDTDILTQLAMRGVPRWVMAVGFGLICAVLIGAFFGVLVLLVSVLGLEGSIVLLIGGFIVAAGAWVVYDALPVDPRKKKDESEAGS